MIRLLALLAIAIVTSVASAAAQRPERPRLSRDADPNDWEAYYDHGVKMLNSGLSSNAQKAFYWSARLEPSRAEPVYAMRVAIFLSDIRRWEQYLRDDEAALRHPQMVRADSLMDEAMLRSPFVPARWTCCSSTSSREAGGRTSPRADGWRSRSRTWPRRRATSPARWSAIRRASGGG